MWKWRRTEIVRIVTPKTLSGPSHRSAQRRRSKHTSQNLWSKVVGTRDHRKSSLTRLRLKQDQERGLKSLKKIGCNEITLQNNSKNLNAQANLCRTQGRGLIQKYFKNTIRWRVTYRALANSKTKVSTSSRLIQSLSNIQVPLRARSCWQPTGMIQRPMA